MLRDLMNESNTNPDSPLYLKLKNATGCIGYSLGGAACSYFYLNSDPSDNVRFVAPVHPVSVGQADIRRMRIPVFVGGSRQDTVIRTRAAIRDVSP